MEGYALGKDIQEIKDRLARIEGVLGVDRGGKCGSEQYTVVSRSRGDVSLDIGIDISTRSNGSEVTEVCAKVKVKVKVDAVGSGTVSLPEVCLGAEGLCSSVNSGGGDVRAEAEVCWRGTEICAKVTGKIRIAGHWYEHTEEKCVGI